MAPPLKHISPQTKLVIVGLFLVVVPGLFLSYLGYRSSREKANNLRTSTQTTLGLLRDKIESASVQFELTIQGILLKKLENSARETNPHILIDSLRFTLPQISDAVIVANDGSVVSSLLSLSSRVQQARPARTSDLFSSKIQIAEAAEFRSRDLAKAQSLYVDASNAARTSADLALVISRDARCSYKLGDYAGGIKRYRQLLAEKFQTTVLSDVPVSVMARMEIVDGYNALKDSATARSMLKELHREIVDRPWDLRGGTYLYLLRSTARRDAGETATQPGHSEESREAAILSQAMIIDAVGNFTEATPEVNRGSTRHLRMKEPGSIAWCGFKIPESRFRTRWDRIYFLPDSRFVSKRFLPDILSAVDLGGSLVAGVVDSSGTVLGLPASLDAKRFLAVQDLAGFFEGWKAVLLDRDGRTIDDLVAGEKRSYLALLVGTALVMLGGIVVTVRAAAHEMETARLKTEFVSNVSHELKTPLSLIRMFSETLDSDLTVKETDRKDFIGIIRRESERLTHLVNNILDFSRIDSGKREYHLRSADAVDVVRRALEAFRFRIQEQGLSLVTCFPEHPVLMDIDPEAITQAVLNLVDNAIKYSGPSKEIRVEIKEKNGTGLIVVHDQGVGIEAKDMCHIFERFYRGSSQKTKETRGTGIGLSLAKEAVEAHGGTIDVASVPLKGSTFTITVPLSNRIH